MAEQLGIVGKTTYAVGFLPAIAAGVCDAIGAESGITEDFQAGRRKLSGLRKRTANRIVDRCADAREEAELRERERAVKAQRRAGRRQGSPNSEPVPVPT